MNNAGEPGRLFAELRHRNVFRVAGAYLEALRGDPRSEALLARLHEKVEAERNELGLEPLNT